MVVLRAADYARLAALAEDAEDIVAGRAGLASMEQEGTVPGEVVALIINDGLTPVAAWRRHRGLTQSDLARRAGLSQVWVNRIEAGKGHGTPATRRKLAVALDAPEWALDGLGEADELATEKPIMDKQTFKNEIELQLDHARQTGKTSLLISAGEIHRAVGGYPGSGHRMPICCAALRELADELNADLVSSPPKGNGASLAYRFSF
ncbi:helix-turn-helix transcriptional regulator [Sandarakinorhabdus sp.]|uniref:helix-turn-helix domain-containing protein n=1 Tax=Sandarakinorhabdus sp. TaxID=1916663 RepID=UPI0028B0FEBE|nr:helix-turn-helix transcriptional regulator [Sandarakinorhabdus sp.]